MANLPELENYDAGVYQIETSDPVLGGVGGVTNTPLKNLANRTKWLKKHVDDLESGALVPTGAATQAWVNGELQKIDLKASVRIATVANISLSGLQTIDGVTLIAGDRVLVRAQSAGQDNGIYVAAVGAWARSADANTSEKVTPGLMVYVESGTTQADIIYKLTTDAPVTLGSTVLTFADILAAVAVPAASETVSGRVEFATAAETTAGASNALAVHPAGLKVELDKKAAIASPTFTGNPAAPTAAQFDNDTSLATTEFVQRALGSMSGNAGYAVSSAVPITDAGKRIAWTAATSGTLTLPDIGTVTPGTAFFFHAVGAALTVSKQAGQEIMSADNVSVANVALAVGDTVMIIRGGVAWSVVSGSKALGNFGAFGASISASGYQKLPSGLIIQWGTVSVTTTSSSGSATFSFPIAFPAACVSLSALYKTVTAGNDSWSVYGSAISTSQATITYDAPGAAAAPSGAKDTYWVAIGY